MLKQEEQGITFAGCAFLLWGIFPVFWKQLGGVPPYEVVAHRIFWSVTTLAVLLLFWQKPRKECLNLIRSPRALRALLCSGALLSSNWLIFIWAVNTGYILECSLGYFITPLINVLLGVLLLGERLRVWQGASIFCAACGVIYLSISYGTVPWIALALAVTFGLYGLIRKTVSAEAISGVFVETTLLALPAAIAVIAMEMTGSGSFLNSPPSGKILLALSGPVTTIPLLLFVAGARRITLVTLGMLQYLAPTLQFLLAVYAYGEPFTSVELRAFSLIWLAIALYSAEGYLSSRKIPSGNSSSGNKETNRRLVTQT